MHLLLGRAHSIHIARHVSAKITSGATERGEGGVAGEGKLVGVPKFHSWGKCTMPLNVQRFLWHVYYSIL